MKTSRFMPMLFLAHLMSKMSPEQMDVPKYRGMAIGGYNPMFIPRRGKYKGWMKEKCRSSFNKNK